MSKRKTAKTKATPGLQVLAAMLPAVGTAPKPKRRRRRRSAGAILAQRVVVDVKKAKLEFLRKASTILTDALGFQVRVSLATPKAAAMPPDMRKASRMTKKQTRRYTADMLNGGVLTIPRDKATAKLDDPMPF